VFHIRLDLDAVGVEARRFFPAAKEVFVVVVVVVVVVVGVAVVVTEV
jgi:hypothetical protein